MTAGQIEFSEPFAQYAREAAKSFLLGRYPRAGGEEGELNFKYGSQP